MEPKGSSLKQRLSADPAVFWRYHSGSTEEPREWSTSAQQARYLPFAARGDQATFKIEFQTGICVPAHVVTIRNELWGWGRDIHGVFLGDRWHFTLSEADYPTGFEFKFVLDGALWMEGPNLHRPANGPGTFLFADQEVVFTGFAARYAHGYDNLQNAEDVTQQEYMHVNYDENITHDVIIIGSGMGGGILADALTDMNGRTIKVLVLDIGSLEFPSHIYNLPSQVWGDIPVHNEVGHYDKVGDTQLQNAVQMNFGGRSVHWSAVIPRMQEWELPWWPKTVADYLSTGGGYTDAEKLMRKHVTLGTWGQGVITQLQAKFPHWKVDWTPRAEHQPNLTETSFIQYSSGAFSTAELLLDSLATKGPVGRDNLCINLNHLVTHLEFANGRINAVHCQDLIGNRTRRYKAHCYVLAAGSFESAKIALRSIRDSGLPNPHNRVGVGLTDHSSFFFDRDHNDTPLFLKNTSPFAGRTNHGRFLFYPKTTLPGLHRFNVEININGDYWRERHADEEIWQQRLAAHDRTQFWVKFACASPLINTNHVQLGPNDNSKLQVKVSPNDTGFETRDTVRDLLKELIAFFEVDFDPAHVDQRLGWGRGGTPHHAGGSLRMSGGRDTQNDVGVVDTNLKWDGVDNLYVCDVSVFPFIPAANPSLTLAALAQRLARHIATKLPVPPP